MRTQPRVVVLVFGIGLSLAGWAQAAGQSPVAEAPADYAGIVELQQQMAHGSLDSQQLVRDFVQRIEALDQAGPRVNAVLQLNPDALKIAVQRDQQRKTGERGPLWGIPILLKANIDTGDRMPTTAGSLALLGAPAPRDATVAAKLREAGAVILGKANLSEWANFRSTHSSSGWSGRGGLTRNPYVLDRSACGSSSGSAVAVAAGFATAAIGTETNGSIICPAAANGIVGIKPTVGLVSRAGIIPISSTQDTAGPMARDVRDAAIVLTAIAGSDPRDPATRDAHEHATDYTKFLDPDALKGKRIGVVRELSDDGPEVAKLLDQAIAVLRAHGATVVDKVKIPHLNDYGKAESIVLQYEFKHGVNAYLATRKGLQVHSLADLIAFDTAHAAEEMPWFGQETFIAAEARGPLTDKVYEDALAKLRRLAGPEGIDAAMNADHLDALLAPAQGPAWRIDLVNGDPDLPSAYGPAAVAGYPSITVPAGFVHGLPVGMLFFGRKWSEPTLIGVGYAYEQATHARRNPEFLTTLPAPQGIDAWTQKSGASAHVSVPDAVNGGKQR
ncbi:MAG: amidase family protein [Rhodanobacteraceae bacterium]|jgi:amidase|nr:MAG: amidase family protein [Rhodanobacteraceae bacterium]